MVMITSAPRQAAGTESAALPLADASLDSAGFTTSKPMTSWPALSRFCAIGRPMLPSPMNPIFAMCLSPQLVAQLLRLFARGQNSKRQIGDDQRRLEDQHQ